MDVRLPAAHMHTLAGAGAGDDDDTSGSGLRIDRTAAACSGPAVSVSMVELEMLDDGVVDDGHAGDALEVEGCLHLCNGGHNDGHKRKSGLGVDRLRLGFGYLGLGRTMMVGPVSVAEIEVEIGDDTPCRCSCRPPLPRRLRHRLD